VQDLGGNTSFHGVQVHSEVPPQAAQMSESVQA